MHLVDALVCGVRGCEAGSAVLYRRGTSTRATYYSSFEADSSSTADITLDENGGAVVYVNEVVDVIVRDGNGTSIREFTAGAAAPAVELISAAFTGTDYESGATAASLPTTVATALGRWITSAGAKDFQVLVNGSAMDISDAIGRGYGVFYNVMSAEFGAIGDGVTNDATAINAAAAAAHAAGGGTVFFPSNTYRHAAQIVVYDDVQFLGAPGAVLVPSGLSAAAVAVSHAVGAETPFRMASVNIEPNVAHAYPLISAATLVDIDVEDCTLGSAYATGDIVSLGADCRASIRRSLLKAAGATSSFLTGGASDGQHVLDEVTAMYVGTGAWTASAFVVYGGEVSRSTFSTDATSGTVSWIDVPSLGGPLQIRGTAFSGNGGLTTTAVDFSSVSGNPTTPSHLSGNTFASIGTKYDFGSAYNAAHMYDRAKKMTSGVTSSTTADVESSVYQELLIYRQGSTGNLDISATDKDECAPCSLLTVMVTNAVSGGASISVGFSASDFWSAYPTSGRLTLANGSTAVFTFVKGQCGSTFTQCAAHVVI